MRSTGLLDTKCRKSRAPNTFSSVCAAPLPGSGHPRRCSKPPPSTKAATSPRWQFTLREMKHSLPQSPQRHQVLSGRSNGATVDSGDYRTSQKVLAHSTVVWSFLSPF